MEKKDLELRLDTIKNIIEELRFVLTVDVKIVEGPKWFFNSRGEIQKTDNIDSARHKKRIAFGNAFRTREDAVAALKEVKEMLFCNPKSGLY